jgi:hypothetical protein
LFADLKAFVVVVYSYREDPFGSLLTDHIFIEQVLDLGWYGQPVGTAVSLGDLSFFRDNIVAEIDTFVTDIH